MLKKAFVLVLAAVLSVGLALPATALEYDELPPVRSIQMSNNSIRLEEGGDPIPLFVRFSPYGTTDDVEWSSSDDDVATVDSDGTVYGVGRGNAIITAETAGGKKATCRVEVNDADRQSRVSRVEMNFEELTVRLGQTRQLIARISPSDADEDERDLTWESRDGDIAGVDPDGTVHGISLGTTTITARAGNGKSASCRVTVAEAFGSGTVSTSNTRAADSATGTGSRTVSSANSKADAVTGTLTTSAVQNAVSRVSGELSGDEVGTVTFVDSGLITPEQMTAAANATKGGTVMLRFASTGEDGKKNGYLELASRSFREIKSNIATGVYVDSEAVKSAEKTFDKYYQNKTTAVQCAQSDGFGGTVRIQARVDLTGMKTDNLVFYSYADNTVKKLDVATHSVDANGFLHFPTSVGGTIVISEGTLVKK